MVSGEGDIQSRISGSKVSILNLLASCYNILNFKHLIFQSGFEIPYIAQQEMFPKSPWLSCYTRNGLPIHLTRVSISFNKHKHQIVKLPEVNTKLIRKITNHYFKSMYVHFQSILTWVVKYTYKISHDFRVIELDTILKARIL